AADREPGPARGGVGACPCSPPGYAPHHGSAPAGALPERRVGAMIEGSDITKKYGAHTILDGASIAVRPGECVVLTGDNGSGKTTLLHVLVGLRRPDVGEVRWKGEVLTGAGPGAWREAREAWGFMPQQVGLP